MENRAKYGFTLVELSIVLVILGLLVGGVVAGQSIIRASEIKGIIETRSKYETAVVAFRDKFRGLPGDLRTATDFFGAATVNGSGDGNVSAASGGGLTGEMFQFWNQLALAELIEGNYTGLSGAAGSADAVIGTNVPEGNISNSGWSTVRVSTAGHSSYFDSSSHHFIFGRDAAGSSHTLNPVLSPPDVQKIDMKADDGQPALGDVGPYPYVNCTSATAGQSTNWSATYITNNSAVLCSVLFRNQY